MAKHIVIPARYASSRLPGKPLALISGVPMIIHVAALAAKTMADNVVVAVDDQGVLDVVLGAGYQGLMTRADHPSGSDRVMQVVDEMGWEDKDLVINIQGDEPMLPPQIVDDLFKAMVARTNIEMATLSEPIAKGGDFLDPNVVKVLVGDDLCAINFSRAPTPYPRESIDDEVLFNAFMQSGVARRHIGIYGFRVSGLRSFVGLGESRLERVEKLEQLRWIEARRDLLVLDVKQKVPGGVDTPEDLARVQKEFVSSGYLPTIQ
jgi:3-deoxy-manno-octulosonate cytidylyltransferase (CMP-KDO synthetase)